MLNFILGMGSFLFLVAVWFLGFFAAAKSIKAMAYKSATTPDQIALCKEMFGEK